MAAHPCALLAQTGVGEGGIPHPHPRSCASLACVSGTQGAGVVPRAGFPCPVEVQAMPPLVKRGWEGGAAASPALIVLSNEWGRVAKSGEGCVPFGCRPTHPVCAQRRGANPARGRGREQGPPHMWRGRAQVGATRQAGERTCKLCFHARSPSLPPFVCRVARKMGGRVEGAEEREEGGGKRLFTLPTRLQRVSKRTHCSRTYYFPLFVFI